MSRRSRQKPKPNQDRSAAEAAVEAEQDAPEAKQGGGSNPTRLLLLLWGIPIVVIIAALVVRMLRGS